MYSVWWKFLCKSGTSTHKSVSQNTNGILHDIIQLLIIPVHALLVRWRFQKKSNTKFNVQQLLYMPAQKFNFYGNNIVMCSAYVHNGPSKT